MHDDDAELVPELAGVNIVRLAISTLHRAACVVPTHGPSVDESAQPLVSCVGRLVTSAVLLLSPRDSVGRGVGCGLGRSARLSVAYVSKNPVRQVG